LEPSAGTVDPEAGEASPGPALGLVEVVVSLLLHQLAVDVLLNASRVFARFVPRPDTITLIREDLVGWLHVLADEREAILKSSHGGSDVAVEGTWQRGGDKGLQMLGVLCVGCPEGHRSRLLTAGNAKTSKA